MLYGMEKYVCFWEITVSNKQIWHAAISHEVTLRTKASNETEGNNF